MQCRPVYKDKIGCENADEVFAHLIATLKDTITGWDYFVNWSKVQTGTKKAEKHLNLLNYLIGKENIREEAIGLFREYPELVSTIPLLLASRESKFHMLKEYQRGAFVYEDYDLSKKSDIAAEKAVEFLDRSGFLKQLQTKHIKSLVDYVFGVEAGLESNGRKNRGGKAMEAIVEHFVSDICQRNGYEYMEQATAPKMKQQWGRHVTVDKSTRRIDFAINTPEKLVLIETNFYAGGGSKLKSTAGEYRTLHNFIEKDGHQFVWVTDGAGWRTTQRPLQETFNAIDYILNLDMVEKGLLEDAVQDA